MFWFKKKEKIKPMYFVAYQYAKIVDEEAITKVHGKEVGKTPMKKRYTGDASMYVRISKLTQKNIDMAMTMIKNTLGYEQVSIINLIRIEEDDQN